MPRRPGPQGVDPSQPHSARVWDYLLGGKDNFAQDREVARQLLQVAPDTRTLAWLCRKFLTGATTLVAESGVRQFVDLGAGIPRSPSVFEVAAKIDPGVRVISVDYDPVVYVHANAMLAGESGTVAMLADIRQPDDLIDRLRSEAHIDFARPTAVLAVGVLDYVMDEEHPAEIIARLRDALAPGSYLALTHGSTQTASEVMERTRADTRGSPAQCTYRSPAEVAELVAEFDILDPGLVPIQDWLGDDLPQTRMVVLGGICQKKRSS